jgi:hypothetical protein
MLLTGQNLYYANQAVVDVENHYTSEQRISAYARQLFQDALRRGRMAKLRQSLLGSAIELKDLSQLTRNGPAGLCGGRSLGLRSVAIDQIVGSEGRCADFDRDFHPLQSHTAQRWQRVATARGDGMALPPVELIKVGGEYYVRDGHHRISVARAQGQRCIDAIVYAWQG